MKYRVTHTTKYIYGDPVPVCHNKVHLAPLASTRQTVDSSRLMVLPEPSEIRSETDFFGNRVDYFSLIDSHSRLAVTAKSVVEVRPSDPLAAEDTSPWEEIAASLVSVPPQVDVENCLYMYDSHFARRDAALADFARSSFPPGRPIAAASQSLTRKIFEEFKYDPRVTNVSTPVAQVLQQKAGVCQDFAHLAIACLRSLGLAARYVSGYLRTIPPPGKPRLVGADASHAWLSVYCGGIGWVDFDPTNNVIPSADHISVAVGRDYGDVCPIQGVFVGGGEHSMSVSVDVEPI